MTAKIGMILAAALVAGDRAECRGLFHLAGQGSTSWAGFAREIFAGSARLGGPTARVEEIATQDFPTKARRPANSRLSSEKFAAVFGWRPPPYEYETEKLPIEILTGAPVGKFFP